ncbi:hypothetical protein [Brevibacillus gelatini]
MTSKVSLCTVYRDLESIKAAGIPIVAYPGTSGGYEIMENAASSKRKTPFCHRQASVV